MLLNCGHARVRTMNPKLKQGNVVSSTYWYFLWGALPTHSVDTAQLCGSGSSYTGATYYISAPGYVIGLITLGLMYSVNLEITCASAN